MDPQACLQRILDACAAKEWDEAFYAIGDLDVWLANRGFAPKVPPSTYVALGDGGRDAYSILSWPKGDGADFIHTRFSEHTGQFEVFARYEMKGST